MKRTYEVICRCSFWLAGTSSLTCCRMSYQDSLKSGERKTRPSDAPDLEDVHLDGEIPSAHAAPTFRGIPSLVGMR